jgi:GT2 family glycosyltransferase
MRLSVIVVNWNSREDLEACLESVRAQAHTDLETIVVDNASADGSVELCRTRFPEVKLLEQSENLGFAEACNRGVEASSSEWVVLLNNDAVADPGWAAALARAAAKAPDHCGMLQSLMLFMDRPEEINSTGIELTRSGGGRDRLVGKARATALGPGAGSVAEPSAWEEIFCPTGGAAAYRRSMLDALRLPVGYFDRDHFCYSEDMDLGWRARIAGWSSYFIPDSIVHHRYNGSTARMGRSWLVVMTRTNRLRTLVKNASVPFLVTTAPTSLLDVWRLFWHGGPRATVGLFRAARGGLDQRRHVARLARRSRRSVERAWVTR